MSLSWNKSSIIKRLHKIRKKHFHQAAILCIFKDESAVHISSIFWCKLTPSNVTHLRRSFAILSFGGSDLVFLRVNLCRGTDRVAMMLINEHHYHAAVEERAGERHPLPLLHVHVINTWLVASAVIARGYRVIVYRVRWCLFRWRYGFINWRCCFF